jgi:hypothetical protein
MLKRIEGGADVVEAAVVSEGTNVPRSLRLTRRGVPFLLRRTAGSRGDPGSGVRFSGLPRLRTQARAGRAERLARSSRRRAGPPTSS